MESGAAGVPGPSPLSPDMNQPLTDPERLFFGTRILPCPYIQGRMERKVVTHLSGPDAGDLYEWLSEAGFRRSHGVAYRPACPRCDACVPVRIPVTDFRLTRSFRRVINRNADLTFLDMDAAATEEQYRLFEAYQRTRHGGGEMSSMSFEDYREMVEESPVASRVVEYRDSDGALVAVMLMDRLRDSLSAVYSFFDARLERRSLGTYMILSMVGHARELGLSMVYLGYWIEGSEKMDYKARFRPLEVMGSRGWRILEA